MEQFNPEHLEWPSISPETQAMQAEALLNSDMESVDRIAEDGNINQTREIVSSLASSNPLLAQNLLQKQTEIWGALVSQMQNVSVSQGWEQAWEQVKSIPELWEYFGVSNLVSIQEELSTDGLNLDVSQYLNGYVDYIENDLAELQPDIKEKIIASIWIRISKIWDIVQKIKKEHPEDIAGQRWILNTKIQDNLGEINKKILPSAFMLQEYGKAESREAFIEDTIANMEFEEYENWPSQFAPSTVTVEFQQDIVRGMLVRNITQSEEMFQAPVDAKSWEFDEFGFNGIAQIDTLQVNMWWHAKRFEAMGWDISKISEITMLSEADQAIQSDAMVAYLITVLSQLIPYAWAVTSVPADLMSTLTNQDGVMKWLKASGVVPKEFHMEEFPVEWLVGLASLVLTVGWAQWLAKAGKLWKVWKAIGRIKPSVLMKSFADMWEKMWIRPDTMKKIKEMLFGKVEETKNLDFSADDIARLELAEWWDILWRKLTDSEKTAIIQAHRIWERWEDGRYYLWDIKGKIKALKDAWFSNSERRLLLDNNICWEWENIKNISKLDGILENVEIESIYKKFPFLEGEWYEKVRELLWPNFTTDRLIGEWMNAIFISYIWKNWEDIGIKIPKRPWFKINEEAKKQDIIWIAFRKLKIKRKQEEIQTQLVELWKVDETKVWSLDKFKIPWTEYADEWNDFKNYIEMEKLDAQSFMTKFYLEFYQKELSDIPTETLNSLNDWEIIEILDSRKLFAYTSENIDNSTLSAREIDRFMDAYDYFSLNFKERFGIDKFTDALAEIWYKHWDEHPWNFMIDKDGNIFMIDFGNAVKID